NAHLPSDRLMALSNVEGRRCPHPLPCLARDRLVASRNSLRDSFLGMSGALYLSVLEQPESRTLFSTLLKDKKVLE
ncbi:MAG: hypothetical protein H6Q48_367, partial [Deltaproteobacteria bacterium]|nr:hypothetical protein [Deltaproteobacteria bacterium]